MVNSIEIEYLEPKNEFRVGSLKNIAVPSNNVDDIKKSYPNSKKNESNADMLSQSFGTAPEITPIPEQLKENNSVQISPIPVVQKSNLEKEPVDLNTTLAVPEIPIVESVNIPEVASVEPVLNVPTIDNNNVLEVKKEEDTLSTENIVNEVQENKPQAFESSFKVTDAPNIFDNPTTLNKVEDNNVVETPNIFNQPIQEEKVSEESVTQMDISDDLFVTEMDMLEKEIKYHEELIKIKRKKIEILKKKINKEVKDVNLENTASNLFNSNGVLDEEQVLGETPMPTLRAT